MLPLKSGLKKQARTQVHSQSGALRTWLNARKIHESIWFIPSAHPSWCLHGETSFSRNSDHLCRQNTGLFIFSLLTTHNSNIACYAAMQYCAVPVSISLVEGMEKQIFSRHMHIRQETHLFPPSIRRKPRQQRRLLDAFTRILTYPLFFFAQKNYQMKLETRQKRYKKKKKRPLTQQSPPHHPRSSLSRS